MNEVQEVDDERDAEFSDISRTLPSLTVFEEKNLFETEKRERRRLRRRLYCHVATVFVVIVVVVDVDVDVVDVDVALVRSPR